MGAKQSISTLASREAKKIEKERRKNVQNHIINQRKEEISAIENNVLSHGVQDIKVLKEVIQATTYAQNQLERGGKPFNKGDLVAIIVAIDNQQVNNIDKLNSYRIEDLNALIRVIIYDSKHFISQNNMILNSINTSSNQYKKVVKETSYEAKTNNVKENNYAMVIKNAPPLPPKPESKNKNMLTLTYDNSPSYALVCR